MSKSIAQTPQPYPTPPGVARSRIASARRFRRQSEWKGVLDAAAPLTPAQWLDVEIQRLAAAVPDRALAAQSITEALRIAGDRSNPYATASAAEYLSVVRLPGRPRRNADLSAASVTAGGERR